MSDDEKEEEFERGYEAGKLRTGISLAQELRSLMGSAFESTNWHIERAETVAKLRQLCAAIGDNDWPDDLYLPDIIDKHLGDWEQ